MTDEELTALKERYITFHKLATITDPQPDLPMPADAVHGILAMQDTLFGEDIPVLLTEVERLRAENTALREIVRDVAEADVYYTEQPIGWYCTMCEGFEPDFNNGGEKFHHDPDCPVTKARALLGKGE